MGTPLHLFDGKRLHHGGIQCHENQVDKLQGQENQYHLPSCLPFPHLWVSMHNDIWVRELREVLSLLCLVFEHQCNPFVSFGLLFKI